MCWLFFVFLFSFLSQPKEADLHNGDVSAGAWDAQEVRSLWQKVLDYLHQPSDPTCTFLPDPAVVQLVCADYHSQAGHAESDRDDATFAKVLVRWLGQLKAAALALPSEQDCDEQDRHRVYRICVERDLDDADHVQLSLYWVDAGWIWPTSPLCPP